MPRNFSAGWARLATIAVFAGFLVLGLRLVKDYGMHWDDLQSHYFGVRWYDYARDVLVKGVPVAPMSGVTEHDVVHGPVIEMTFAAIEDRFFARDDVRGLIFFRHYGTWLIYFAGVVCFHWLAGRFFAHRGFVWLATAFLVLHPRIFSHAFYDSVDLPFLSFYIISLTTLVLYLERRTLATLCLHAMACAVLIDIRSMGGVIPAITMVVLLAEWADRAFHRVTTWWLGLKTGLYLVAVTGATIALWPYLWDHPVARVLDVIRQTPRVAWEGTVLYLGEYVKATELPWHYLPVWIAITTPITCSGFFVVGLIDGLQSFGRRPREFYRHRSKELVLIAAVLLPVLAVILLKAVVFDSWRHLFFIYPAFVLIAVAGVQRTLGWLAVHLRGRWRVVLPASVALVVAADLGVTAAFMVRNHPYGNVYFNWLAGESMTAIKQRFEMDYWGLSYRAALEYVLARDAGQPVRIYDENSPLILINSFMLPPPERDRIQRVSRAEATYVFTNFRWRLQGYPDLPEYFSVKVDGEPIMSVYKVPRD